MDLNDSNRRPWSPRSPEEKLEEGLRLERTGALERADELYRQVVEELSSGPLRARALLRRAHVHRTWGVWPDAVRLAREGRALARRLGDTELEAELINAEAAVHQAKGALVEAEALFAGMLRLARSPRVRGVAHQNLAANAALRGAFAEADHHFTESSRCFQEAGYRRGEAMALSNRGRLLLDRDRPADARHVLERAAALAGEVEDQDLHAMAVLNLAEAHLLVDALDHAEDCVSEAYGYFSYAQNNWRVVECLRIQGDIARRRGDVEQAWRAWSKGVQMARSLGARIELRDLEERLGTSRTGHSAEPTQTDHDAGTSAEGA